MGAKKKALGRGLGALIPTTAPKPKSTPSQPSIATGIPISQIDPNPDQPRQYFDEDHLEELAASIRIHGVIQPLLLREIDGRYQIVAGERRWRASQLAGLDAVPAMIEDISSQDQLEIALIENLQREDLNPMEEARAYQQLITRYRLSQERIATQVGKARATVANALRLLKLPVPMQRDIEAGRISPGHARALLSISNFPGKQLRLFKAILSDDLSVRAAEQMARRLTATAPPKPTPPPPQDPQLRALEDKLSEALGALSTIKPTGPTQGRITINYSSLDDLDRILTQLHVDADTL